MKYVYIIRSESSPDRFYVGSSIDLRKRLEEHNAGKSIHTDKFKPWRIVTYTAFADHTNADRFEKYLKTASGRTFAKRHFSER